jgi:hypothetical protein
VARAASSGWPATGRTPPTPAADALTRTLAIELADRDITINAVDLASMAHASLTGLSSLQNRCNGDSPN